MFDEKYVQEVMKDAGHARTRKEFREWCHQDINANHAKEIAEAERSLFDRQWDGKLPKNPSR